MNARRYWHAAMLFVWAVAAPARAAAEATFRGLGIPAGQTASGASDVSADGAVVVGSSDGERPLSGRAFRWTAACGLISFQPARSELNTTGWAVSPLGNFTLGENGANAYVWNAAGPNRDLGIYGAPPFLPGISYGAMARGSSTDGSVVVGSSSSHVGHHAFRWTGETGMTSLGYLTPGHTDAIAEDVSADGGVIVGVSSSAAAGQAAFRWTQQTGMTPLGFPPSVSSAATAVSHDGSTIVGHSGSGTTRRAFRWTAAGGPVDIAGAATSSFAGDVSADGSVVVGRADGQAFIWHADTGMLPLRQVLLDGGAGAALQGWTLTIASGISADGRTIAGQGINPAGALEAWVATVDVVPEPAATALLAGWSTTLLLRRRRGAAQADLRTRFRSSIVVNP